MSNKEEGMKSLFRLGMLVIMVLTMACQREKKAEISGSGTMEATEVMLSSKSAGTIVKLAVHEGDRVRKGEVVALIDSEKVVLQERQLLAGIEELRLNMINARRGADLAKESLDNVNKKYGRIHALRQTGSATQQQYEDVENGLKAAQTQYDNAVTSLQALQARNAQLQAQLGLVRSQLSDTRVVSPVDATVVETFVEEGELARPAGPIANLADLLHMWVKIYITEKELGQIRLSGQARLFITSRPDQAFPGQITWISPKAEFTPKNVQTKEARADLVYAVKISVENPDGALKIGMPVDVVIAPAL
jgi:HlyD family secretion protein